MPEEKEIAAPGRKRRLRRRGGHQKYEKVVLIGNPNVGKSVIFGLLTGKYVTVSNYPGTTVEVSYGNTIVGGKNFIVVDSPGVNNLTPMSEDEKVTRDILLRERPEAVVLVSDAKNLKRGLMLLIQLSEMGLPCVLDLNMEDEARARGIEIDYESLGSLLNIEVIGTVAPERKGMQKLREAILRPRQPSLSAAYPSAIEEYAERIGDLLPETNISKRSLALMILSGDESLRDWLVTNLVPGDIKRIEDLRDEAQGSLKDPIPYVISQARIRLAQDITERVQINRTGQTGTFARKLDKWTTHPVIGVPILLLVIACFYGFVGKLGAGVFVDFFQEVIFGRYLTPAIEKATTALIPVPFIKDMLVGRYGIFTMALTYALGIILPITTTFFLAFGFLEDSGYLPRLAVVSNRFFRLLGLNGKAVLPMVLGLGCGTMATMSTRILETGRERVIATFLIALAIPCSAQLGVIFGMLGPLPVRAALWWTGCIIAVLLFTGYLAAKVIPGEKPDFFIELPPLRVPTMRNIVMKTLSRIEWYLKEAVPLFALGTLILFLLDRIALLGWLESEASPLVVNFLGLPAKTTEAFLMGFLRRDYGAAGMFDLARRGLMNENQIIVSLVTLTLFVPCLANLFMMVKERGMKTAFLMMALIIPFALLVGGALNLVLGR